MASERKVLTREEFASLLTIIDRGPWNFSRFRGQASACRIFVGFGSAAFSLSIGVIKKRRQAEVGGE
jgi:hypothetical protein